MDEWRQQGSLAWLTVDWAAVAGGVAFFFWGSGLGRSPATITMSILAWLIIPATYVQSVMYLRNGRIVLRPDSITHIDWRGREQTLPRDASTKLAEGRFRGAACYFLQSQEGRQIILPKRRWQLDDPKRAEMLRQGLAVVNKRFLRPLP